MPDIKSKRKPKRSKRKRKDKPTFIGPETHLGYSIGQEVFCICISDGKLGYGRITQFHLNCADLDNSDIRVDCFSFVCLMRGSYQTSYMRDIIPEPTKKHRDAMTAALTGSSRRKNKS